MDQLLSTNGSVIFKKVCDLQLSSNKADVEGSISYLKAKENEQEIIKIMKT